jgi:hypothetical protein
MNFIGKMRYLSAEILTAKHLSAKILSAKILSAKILSAEILTAKNLTAKMLSNKIFKQNFLANKKFKQNHAPQQPQQKISNTKQSCAEGPVERGILKIAALHLTEERVSIHI